MATAKKTVKKTTKKTTKTTKASAKKVEAQTSNVIEFARKGALAYVGLYGMAYERAQFRFNQLREATDGLFDELVERGEKIEEQAGETFKGARAKVEETVSEGSERFKAVLPAAAKTRVTELEGEIAALNKKIVSMSKKARTSAKKMTTEKTEKAA